ncbi:MAG: AMP-binding protein [Rhodospirillaceae bacterium]|nr:AMP-binding protein [Rhodospirillaceae bacterium]
MEPGTASLKTTKAVRDVVTIADIEALEARPYDELVPARTLLDLVRATAALHPDRPAVTTIPAGGYTGRSLTVSHRDLHRNVVRAANLFHELSGGREGGTVAFLGVIVDGMMEALLGAQVAGVAGTINYLLNAEVIADLLAAQNATVLVVSPPDVDAAVWDKAQAVIERAPGLRHVVVLGKAGSAGSRVTEYAEAAGRHGAEALAFEPRASRDTVCALFHTGGTTGRPKLVRLTHGNQIHAAWSFAQVHGLDENDTVIDGFPLFHVGGTITAGLSVMAAGGHVIMPSPYSLRDREAIRTYWRMVEAFRVTIVSGVPTSIAALAEVPVAECDISSVRMGLTGGAVCPKAVSERFLARTGIRLYETYGMTETAAAIAFNPGRGTPMQGSVGFRAPFARTRIVSLDPADRGAICPPLTSGLVQVRGPQVFPGYLDPRHDEGVWTADGWLITGDVGYLTEDQRLVLTGREKDLIVRSGHNINPADIEDVANAFPGVQISAAVGMPDAYAGEVPVLFAVPAPGARLDPQLLQRYMDEHVAEPPARPRRVFLIDALPTTAVGKITKGELRDRAVIEKVKLEVERIFAAPVACRVDVARDEKLNTVVRVELQSDDAGRVKALTEALAALPQRYTVVARPRDPASPPVLLSRSGAVATITLNRPDSLNAMSGELIAALDRVLDELAADRTVRAAIVTGAGRAFSAGGDLRQFGRQLEEDPRSLLATMAFNQRVLGKVEELPFPVIAAVNGVAVAGGLELILCCDVVVASDRALIGDGHAKYAVVPTGGATVRLFARMPAGRALHLLYSAELFPAARLQEWGLVNEVVASDRLLGRAREIAALYSRHSPEVLRHMKRLARGSCQSRARDGLRAELEAFEAHLASRDLAEGLAAFREKRKPNY